MPHIDILSSVITGKYSGLLSMAVWVVWEWVTLIPSLHSPKP